MSLNRLSKQFGIPLLGILGHPNFVPDNPYAFVFWPTPREEAQMLAAKALASKKARVATISLEDEWTLALRDSFEETVRSGGGTVAFSGTVVADETDFAPLIARAKAAAPELILVNLNMAQTGLLIKKLREQGLQQQLLSNVYGAYPGTIVTAGERAVEGLIFEELNARGSRFLAVANRLFPTAGPSAITYCCYAALTAVLTVLRDNPEIRDGESMSKALSALSAINLLDEKLEIRNRQAQFKLGYRTIRNGRAEDL